MSYSVLYQDIGLRDYKEAWEMQEQIFKRLIDYKLNQFQGSSRVENPVPGTLIFVEHPHVYTLGKSGQENNLLLDHIQLQSKGASFYRIDRGGDITYHGPGQIVGYPIFDLEALKIGLKDYIFQLEEAIIRTVGELGLHSFASSPATNSDPD